MLDLLLPLLGDIVGGMAAGSAAKHLMGGIGGIGGAGKEAGDLTGAAGKLSGAASALVNAAASLMRSGERADPWENPWETPLGQTGGSKGIGELGEDIAGGGSAGIGESGEGVSGQVSKAVNNLRGGSRAISETGESVGGEAESTGIGETGEAITGGAEAAGAGEAAAGTGAALSLGAITGVGLAFAGVGVAAIAVSKAMDAWTDHLVSSQEHLGDWSGSIAAANVQLQMQSNLRDIETGQRTGQSYRELIDAQNENKKAWLKWDSAWTNAKNHVAAAWNGFESHIGNFMSGVLESLGLIAEKDDKADFPLNDVLAGIAREPHKPWRIDQATHTHKH